jgi:crossover junction endodeoxyribonuclease RuvC
MTLVVGIDPGINGGVAVLRGDAAVVWSMPTVVRLIGGKHKRRVDAAALTKLCRDHVAAYLSCSCIAFVERAQASPQMGVSSAFGYGEGFGILVGVLAALNVTVRFVTATQWKRPMGLVIAGSRELGRNDARDKSPALDLARRLYPKLAAELAREKDDGRAEALLIAHYGCEVLDEEEAEKVGPLFAAQGRRR